MFWFVFFFFSPPPCTPQLLLYTSPGRPAPLLLSTPRATAAADDDGDHDVHSFFSVFPIHLRACIICIFSRSDAISRPPDRVMFYLSTFRTERSSLCFLHRVHLPSTGPSSPLARARVSFTPRAASRRRVCGTLRELSCAKNRSQLDTSCARQRVLEFRRRRPASSYHFQHVTNQVFFFCT